MTSAAPGSVKEQGRSEFGVALFLGALGVLVIVEALRLPESQIARGPVGPAAVPLVVGALLVVVAVLLAVDLVRGLVGALPGL